MTHVNNSKATWWHKLPMLGLLLFMVLLWPVLDFIVAVVADDGIGLPGGIRCRCSRC